MWTFWPNNNDVRCCVFVNLLPGGKMVRMRQAWDRSALWTDNGQLFPMLSVSEGARTIPELDVIWRDADKNEGQQRSVVEVRTGLTVSQLRHLKYNIYVCWTLLSCDKRAVYSMIHERIQKNLEITFIQKRNELLCVYGWLPASARAWRMCGMWPMILGLAWDRCVLKIINARWHHLSPCDAVSKKFENIYMLHFGEREKLMLVDV